MSKPVILCIDDEPMIRETLNRQIRREMGRDYQIETAENGQDALELITELQAEQVEVALIICDYVMPGMNGSQVLIEVHKQLPMAGTVMLTGKSNLDGVDEAIKLANLYRYISKPWEEQDLVLTVKSALQSYQVNQKLYHQNQVLAQLNKEQEQLIKDLENKDQLLTQVRKQMIQIEKMSSLGSMIAEVTHEINNPINFISGSIYCLDEYLQELYELLALYEKNYPDTSEEIQKLRDEIDLDYVVKDTHHLLTAMHSTTEALKDISRSMRNFSRSDQERKVEYDIDQSIETTLMILTYRLKANTKRPKIQIHYQNNDTPLIVAHPSQINQVFLNLLANAIDAFAEINKDKTYAEIEQAPNQIWITKQYNSTKNVVVVSVRDNAGGIPLEAQDYVFDNLFTTKAVDQGTGIGLFVSRQIIEQNHHGVLQFESEWGVGTEFIVELPVTLPS